MRYRLLRSLPHGFGLGESRVDCGCEGVGFSHMCIWYVSHDQFEGGLSGCRVWPGVVCILGEWEPFSPVSLCSVSEYSEVLFQPLVGSLGLSVRLRVVSGADVLFDIQVFAQFPHCGGRESGVSVGNDLLWEAIVGEDVFAIELGDSYGINRFFAWDEYGSFRAIVVGYRQYGGVVFRRW